MRHFFHPPSPSAGLAGSSPRAWLPWLVFGIACLGSLAIGGITYRIQRDQARLGVEAQLTAIGKLRAEQVTRWLAGQRTAAGLLSQGTHIAEQFAAWQAGGYKDLSLAARLRSRIGAYGEVFGHGNIGIFDPSGALRLSIHADSHLVEHADAIRHALAERAITPVDFHMHGADHETTFALAIPLLAEQAQANRAVGAILVSIPARADLAALLAAWPSTSESGETVLARKRGEHLDIVYASRSLAPEPASLGMPVAAPSAPLARVARGERGILRGGVDFRGHPVLAYGEPIEGMPWMMVAKIDQAEADAPVQRVAWYASMGTLLLMLASGLAIRAWWRRQTLAQEERLRGEAAERNDLQRRYEYLTRFAGDVIVLTDTDGRILEINERVQACYGYAPDELKGHSLAIFGPPEAGEDTARRGHHLLKTGSTIYQAEHRRKDGSRLTVEVNAHAIEIHGQTYFHLLFRDISERIRADQALREREARYRAVIETSADGFWMTDTAGHLLEVNQAYCQRSGYRREELLDMRIADLDAQEQPEDTARHMAEVMRLGHGAFETTHRAKDGSPWRVAVTTSYSPLEGGRVFAFLRDVQRRERSEALLKTRLELSALAMETDLDTLMQAALDAAELYTESRIGFFHFVDDDQETLTLQAWSTNTLRNMCNAQGKGLHYAVDKAGVWADAVLRRAPVIHNDYASLPNKKGMPEGHAPVTRELVVPILRQDKVVAVLGVGNKTGEYDRNDVEVAQQLASMVMDMVSRKRAEEAQLELNARLLEAQRIAKLANWDYEVATRRILWSRRFAAIADLDGEPPNTLEACRGLFHPEDCAALELDIATAVARGEPFQREMRLARAPVGHGYFWVAGDASRDASGAVTRVSGTIQDISERVEAETRLRQAATVFDNTVEGITITDAEGTILAVNRAFSAITGYPEDEVVGAHTRLLKSGRHDAAFYRAMWSELLETGTWSGEIWNRRKNGDIYPEWLAINAVRDLQGGIQQYIAVFTDLSSRVALQAELEFQSRHHPLTGLLNAAGLLEHLRQMMERGDEATRLALFVLNLDRFAQLNESLGREHGDAFLLARARRWESQLGNDALLCHMSADQFAILLGGLDSQDDALEVASRLLDGMRAAIPLDGVERPITLTLSIGVAFYPEDAREPTALLHAAEDAMRQAKADKGNQVRFFDRAQAQRVREWFETESALRGVLERDELFLAYQPQVDTSSGRIVAAEALLRWRQGSNVVPPGRFIHVVEGTDLAEPVSRWVLQAACRQARAWLDRQRPLRVAVNIFSEHVTSGRLVGDVAAVLAETGLPARLLELEVVESSLLKNPEAAARTLRELKRMGVGLALDDFGTGYSSLGYLKHYPFDVLKIDQMFARNVTRDPEDAAIVRSTIALAHNLGMRVLAEGVETAPQLRFLARYDCDELQGYLLCRPTDPAEIEARLMDRRDLRPAEFANQMATPGLLVIEDEPIQAMIMADILGDAGYRVHLADDRDSALAHMDGEAIDLIIADHYLKGTTGVAVLENLRRLYPEVPAIMVSGAQEKEVVVDAVNRSAIRGFLTKPVDPEELLRTIRAVLEARDKD
jgi:diguanylate cyclase (GGDEF)-like protein/PAS domain S-box-containing protein